MNNFLSKYQKGRKGVCNCMNIDDDFFLMLNNAQEASETPFLSCFNRHINFNRSIQFVFFCKLVIICTHFTFDFYFFINRISRYNFYLQV